MKKTQYNMGNKSVSLYPSFITNCNIQNNLNQMKTKKIKSTVTMIGMM